MLEGHKEGESRSLGEWVRKTRSFRDGTLLEIWREVQCRLSGGCTSAGQGLTRHGNV